MNDFETDLAFSHSCEDLPCWLEIYRKAFPDMVEMISHREDGEHQRAGIDRSVILANSKQLLIDEKARRKDYGDILLEYVSNDRTGAPGWVEKQLRADYIAYAFLPTGRAFILPFLQLRLAWQCNKEDWLCRFKNISAQNNGYKTLSVAVPFQELYPAIGKVLRVSFTPEQEPEYSF